MPMACHLMHAYQESVLFPNVGICWTEIAILSALHCAVFRNWVAYYEWSLGTRMTTFAGMKMWQNYLGSWVRICALLHLDPMHSLDAITGLFYSSEKPVSCILSRNPVCFSRLFCSLERLPRCQNTLKRRLNHLSAHCMVKPILPELRRHIYIY